MIVCGSYHTVIKNEKNEIYVHGLNSYGQLGLGDNKHRKKYEKVDFDFGEIKNIACGYGHTIIQNEKNEIYTCGDNYYGQLGLGDDKGRNKFEKVKKNFGEIKNIICGPNSIIIQNKKNEIYVCGLNYFGQFGLGDNENRDEFEKVECDFGEIKIIACVASYMIIKNEKNEIYVCGTKCQFGLNNKNSVDQFEKVENIFGEIYVFGKKGQFSLDNKNIVNQFKKDEHNFGEIKDIICGGNHVVIQNEKNEIYVCGDNEYGQLGLGNNEDRYEFEKVEYDFGKIKKIACGENHTIIQNEKNEVYVCGKNWNGQLGLGDDKHRYQFEKVKYDFGKIKNIACGEYNTVVQNEKNEIYVCGLNGYYGYGEPGLCDHINKFEKVDTDDIFEKIHNFELRLNTEGIVL